MTAKAPRAFNREMYHDHPEYVFYGTTMAMMTALPSRRDQSTTKASPRDGAKTST